jgi:hypothetical protein
MVCAKVAARVAPRPAALALASPAVQRARSAWVARVPLLVLPTLSSVTTGSARTAATTPIAVAVRHARVAPAHVRQAPFLSTAPVQDRVLVALAAPPAFATGRIRDLSAPAAEV